jgi:dipeptidyl aminopeptidase/acylaminoacyl peptidase
MNDERRVLPYGAWPSPIDAAMLAGASVRLGGVALDGADALWIEGRPAQAGRSVLVRSGEDGQARDLTPAPWNVRSRVHEYGGGAFAVRDGSVWFVHDEDQRLYALAPGGRPRALTAPDAYRHADPDPSPDRRSIVCVREDHRGAGEPVNTLVRVDGAGGGVRVIARGHDFYAYPRCSPDGRTLAFIAWDHPDMPWDASVLYLADIACDGTLAGMRALAGGRGESVFQPQWAPDGRLWFVSDANGYWNLHVLDADGLRCVIRDEAEYGMPLWQFAMSSYGFADARTLVAASCREGYWRVEAIDLHTLARTPMPYQVSAVSALVAGGGRALVLAASPTQVPSVLRWDAASGDVDVLRASTTQPLDPDWISLPEAVEFPTEDAQLAHGFFYPPRNPACIASAAQRAPLIVIGHGGPTGATVAALDPAVQFWTSRGFAVLDVNYRGSTGYGRAYRRLLDGAWGVADVADCVHGARYLADAGRVDRARMAIRGRSAGGYTVLAALAFHDTFAVGASYYGIGELEALARDTHKFESHYLDRLVGPYPQCAQLYRERSPLRHLEGLSCPVIFFQGLEDRVVPPNQALMMRDALLAKGIPVACLMFEGEQHGFRRAETIVRTLQAELYFYGRVFGFTPAGDLPPVHIDNL